MRVLVTGATGYIGSAVVHELVDNGHQVVGLVRSDSGAEQLATAGVATLRGSLDDLEGLRAAAQSVDAVAHLAFTNVGPEVDFVAACEADAAAITALGEGLAGTGRPMVITSGTGLVNLAGRDATERDAANWGPRVAGEQAALALVAQDVRISIARMALSVHDGSADRHGFVPGLIALAREKGVSGYVDDGENRWTAVHRLDAARLFRLALESAPAGTTVHGVGDERVPFRRIAEAIGSGLAMPTVAVAAQDADEHFGYLSAFVSLDSPATHQDTTALLGWEPREISLLGDIESGGYLATIGA